MSAFHDIYNVSRLSKNISQPEKFNDIPCWLWMRIEKNAEKIQGRGFQGREKLALGWEKISMVRTWMTVVLLFHFHPMALNSICIYLIRRRFLFSVGGGIQLSFHRINLPLNKTVIWKINLFDLIEIKYNLIQSVNRLLRSGNAPRARFAKISSAVKADLWRISQIGKM